MPSPDRVLAVDPGRDKAGLAVVTRDGACLAQIVVPLPSLADAAQRLARDHEVSICAIGDRTGFRHARDTLAACGIFDSIHPVDEHRSSEDARRLYFDQQHPRGLARLIPVWLRPIPEPLDGYSAWVLGRRYFAVRAAEETT